MCFVKKILLIYRTVESLTMPPWSVTFDSIPAVPRYARVILPHVGRTPGYKKLDSDLVAVAQLPLLSPQAAC